MSEPFCMLPASIMRMSDMGPAAKLVWMVVRAREGSNGEAWPSLRTIAADAGLSPATAKRAIQDLVERGLVRREDRGRGRSCSYSTHRGQNDQGQNDQGQNDQGQNDPRTMVKLSSDHGQNDHQNYIQGTRSKEPKKRARATQDAERIYGEYPRKVGRGKALPSIDRAIGRIAARNGVADPAEWLLGRVREYAAAVATWPAAERQYVPHPATWMTGERYDDDRAEWRRAESPARNGTPANNAAILMQGALKAMQEDAR